MATTNVYANALALQNGARVLDSEKIRRLADATSSQELLKMLFDYGYGDATQKNVDELINFETAALLRFVQDDCQSESSAYCLCARFTYNNYKAAYKSRLTGREFFNVYYPIETDLIEKVRRKDYGDLPSVAAQALTELDEVNADAAMIDRKLTAAMYEDIFSTVKDRLLKKYFMLEVDLNNVAAAYRARRLKIENFADEFVRGGKIPLTDCEHAVTGKYFESAFYGTYVADAAELLVKENFAAYECEKDDYLFLMTDSLLFDMTSFKPFLNYYTTELIELKTIKTIACCVDGGNRDEVFKRLRCVYE